MAELNLHIGVYNHLNGGIDHGAAGGAGALDRLERLDRQLGLLASLELDVLISTEAKGWFEPDDAPLKLAAARLGMTPLWVRAPRHDCNIVIWINPRRLHHPEQHHETHHPFWHAQARTSVRVEDLDERLWLFGAHFSPFVPQIRVQEAYATCDLADGRLTIGGGDFNDDGLADPIPDRSGLPAYKRLRHMRPGGESAASVLHAAELHDMAALLEPMTTSRQPTAGFEDDAPIRCDRLYVCQRLRETPRTFSTLPYDAALSDHRGIHGTLDLSAMTKGAPRFRETP
ncbi:hypothetical protein [Actinocrinis sp.]|uniref:hypothetical protein n=1 Tax=Actinocrinis sp. TaxID=1920516 RepID=UPI002D6B52D5|nr:hypothetical protein [Actinocrinis sp.]HZP51406.1 hypothetical protein [Actinocrinis sp.]